MHIFAIQMFFLLDICVVVSTFESALCLEIVLHSAQRASIFYMRHKLWGLIFRPMRQGGVP